MPFHTHNLREAIWSSAEAQRILSSSKIYGSKTSTSVTTVRLMSGKKKKMTPETSLLSRKALVNHFSFQNWGVDDLLFSISTAEQSL